MEKYCKTKKTENIYEIINVHGCINKRTLPKLYDNFIHFIDTFGIDNTWFLPIAEEEWDAEDVKLYKEQTGKIVDYIIKKAVETNNPSYLTRHAPYDRNINSSCGISRKPCGAGDTYCSITSKGLIYPCHQFYFADFHNELCIGDVFTKEVNNNLNRFFLEYDGSDLNCNKKCEVKNCFRCIAANFNHNKSCILQTQKYYCNLMYIDLENQYIIQNAKKELFNDACSCGSCSCDCEGHHLCRNHTSSIENGCDIVNGIDTSKNNAINVKSQDEILESIIQNQMLLGNLINELNDKIVKL